MSDDFETRVAEVLHRLQPGDVTTYGEVAAEAGRPGLARAVGRILSHTPGQDWPWWRVVNAGGRLVPGNEQEQRRLLEAEGVEFTPSGHVARRGPRRRNHNGI